jgi:hypothetical protein
MASQSPETIAWGREGVFTAGGVCTWWVLSQMNSTVRVTRAEMIILSTMKGKDRGADLMVRWLNHSTIAVPLGTLCST